MSYNNCYTDYIADLAVRAKFALCFNEGADHEGTPLLDLYDYTTNCRVLIATEELPLVETHCWTANDRGKTRLSAIYNKPTDSFDVISFGIKEVISPTKIKVELFDIFSLGPNGFNYIVESKGAPTNLMMDFNENLYGGDYAALMLNAEDQDHSIDMIMGWAWAMIGGETNNTMPRGLLN